MPGGRPPAGGRAARSRYPARPAQPQRRRPRGLMRSVRGLDAATAADGGGGARDASRRARATQPAGGACFPRNAGRIVPSAEMPVAPRMQDRGASAPHASLDDLLRLKRDYARASLSMPRMTTAAWIRWVRTSNGLLPANVDSPRLRDLCRSVLADGCHGSPRCYAVSGVTTNSSATRSAARSRKRTRSDVRCIASSNGTPTVGMIASGRSAFRVAGGFTWTIWRKPVSAPRVSAETRSAIPRRVNQMSGLACDPSRTLARDP